MSYANRRKTWPFAVIASEAKQSGSKPGARLWIAAAAEAAVAMTGMAPERSGLPAAGIKPGACKLGVGISRTLT